VTKETNAIVTAHHLTIQVDQKAQAINYQVKGINQVIRENQKIRKNQVIRKDQKQQTNRVAPNSPALFPNQWKLPARIGSGMFLSPQIIPL
jgi:hypothetical protein